ncbi:MAG: porin family protein [Bacteroidales bacterium]
MKKNKLYILYIICTISILSIPYLSYAQEERSESILRQYLTGLEYQVKAGFNIGGTAPLPLPPQIRSINSYSPNIAIAISGEVTKWLGEKKKFGIAVALKLENKSMSTNATTKNYGMEIVGEGGELVSGRWTGDVKTKVRNSYLSLPLMATCRLSNRWSMKLGPYISYLIDGEFSGYVSNGYLREGTPTGEKVEFTGEKSASYDFSKNLRKFQWGAQLGAEWKAFKHLNVYGDLTWGLNNIFKKDFTTISFAMYPIYLNVGFGYMF